MLLGGEVAMADCQQVICEVYPDVYGLYYCGIGEVG